MVSAILPAMDKLTVINNALSETGNRKLSVLNDGSDEWQVTDLAFDRTIRDLISRHSWPFATETMQLVRVPDADNKSQAYPENGFRLPERVLHLKEVRYGTLPFTDYEVEGRILSCRFGEGVYAVTITMPADADWHPQAEEIVTTYVQARVLRGLNEDFAEARQMEAIAEQRLMEARAHVDQTNPARNMYKSSIALARRTRRR